MRWKKLRNFIKPIINNAIEESLTNDSKNIKRYMRRQALSETAQFVLENMKSAK